ncbi:MAG: RloB family protein [Candidatus Promineifilaceae bacterium]
MTRQFDDLSRNTAVRNPNKVIIAFEGRFTERKYFNVLRERYEKNPNLPRIISLGYTDSSPDKVFSSVHKYVKKKDSDVKKRDQVWIVVDVDEHSTLEDTLNQCDTHGYHYAVSNPCFEFWLLLHICSIEEFNQAQLEAFLINKKTSRVNSVLTEELSRRQLGGGGANKRKVKTYIPFVPSAIIRAEQLDHEAFIPKAIQRSKDRSAPIDDVTKELGSTVYKLVQEILNRIL